MFLSTVLLECSTLLHTNLQSFVLHIPQTVMDQTLEHCKNWKNITEIKDGIFELQTSMNVFNSQLQNVKW